MAGAGSDTRSSITSTDSRVAIAPNAVIASSRSDGSTLWSRAIPSSKPAAAESPSVPSARTA